MKTFTQLAQANVDHYNSHPVVHIAITIAYGVGSLIMINKVAKRIAGIPKD